MTFLDLFNDESNASHKMEGMTLGVVTNTEDPDQLGRIKVKFLLRDKAESESAWARVVVPFAGDQMGFYMLPSVGDEVILAFLGGQLEKPVILGGVWSKTKKPPKDNEKGKNETKMIKTKKGHTLTLCDKDDEARIELKSAKGLSIIIDDKNEKIEIKDAGGSNKLIIDGKGGTMTLNAEKKIALKTGGTELTLDGTANKLAVKSNTVEVKGMQLNFKGDATVKVESGATLEIKAGATMEIKAGAVAQIKGSMVTIN